MFQALNAIYIALKPNIIIGGRYNAARVGGIECLAKGNARL